MVLEATVVGEGRAAASDVLIYDAFARVDLADVVNKAHGAAERAGNALPLNHQRGLGIIHVALAGAEQVRGVDVDEHYTPVSVRLDQYIADRGRGEVAAFVRV